MDINLDTINNSTKNILKQIDDNWNSIEKNIHSSQKNNIINHKISFLEDKLKTVKRKFNQINIDIIQHQCLVQIIKGLEERINKLKEINSKTLKDK